MNNNYWKHLTGEDNPQSVTIHHFINLIPYNQIRDYCLAVVKQGLSLPKEVADRLNEVMKEEFANQTTRKAWKSMVRLGVATEETNQTCSFCQGAGTISYSAYSRDCYYCKNGKVSHYKYTGPVH